MSLKNLHQILEQIYIFCDFHLINWKKCFENKNIASLKIKRFLLFMFFIVVFIPGHMYRIDQSQACVQSLVT